MQALEVIFVSDTVRQAMQQLADVFPALSDYNQGYLAGLGDGLAMIADQADEPSAPKEGTSCN